MSNCVYTTQGNLLCDKNNKGSDAYIQTKFRGGCPVAAKRLATQQAFETYENKFALSQLNSAFKSTMASKSAGMEKFAPVPGHNSLNVADDIAGTYGLPWAPY